MSDPLPESKRAVRPPRRRVSSPVASVISRAEPAMWFTGGAVMICLAMILCLLGFVLWNGATTFWPGKVPRIKTLDGQVLMGEITRTGSFRPEAGVIEKAPELARARLAETNGEATRKLVRIGNYELTGEHFLWVSDFMTEPGGVDTPEWVLVLERLTWGRFYGIPEAFFVGDEKVAATPEAVWDHFQRHHADVRARWERRRHLEKHEVGKVNHEMEKERLAMLAVARESGEGSAPHLARGQHRGRHLPRHLRHRDDGAADVGRWSRRSASWPRSTCASTPSRAADPRHPHLGEQPRRRAVDRLRRVRPRLLRLFPRRQHRPAVLPRGAAGADLRHPGCSGPR
jgi:ABC-type phosphate transport system auxiliary subunit